MVSPRTSQGKAVGLRFIWLKCYSASGKILLFSKLPPLHRSPKLRLTDGAIVEVVRRIGYVSLFRFPLRKVDGVVEHGCGVMFSHPA